MAGDFPLAGGDRFLVAGDSFQDAAGEVDAVGYGGHEAGGGCADVVAGEADSGDDGGGDDEGGGESVAVPLLVFPGDLALHLAHGEECRRILGECHPQGPRIVPAVPIRSGAGLDGQARAG